MPNLTTNFRYNKPLVNNATDADLWGGQLNTNWDSLDADLPFTTSSETADFTVLSTEFNYLFLVDTSGGTVTADLPAAADVFNGFTVLFKVTDTSNTFTIDPNSSETIDGASTLTTDTSLIVVCDGSNWFTAIPNLPTASDSEAGIVELATTAETQAGSSTSLAVTPGGLNAAIGFSEYSESAEQTISAGGTFTFSHGIGRTPTLVQLVYVCKSSELGYSANDEVMIAPSGFGSSASTGVSSIITSSSVVVRYGSSGLGITRADTGASVVLTAGNWRVKVRAWG